MSHHSAPNPGEIAEQMRRRAAEENKTPQQRADELAEAVDELLARDVKGAEEAEVLETAQRIISDALGQDGR